MPEQNSGEKTGQKTRLGWRDLLAGAVTAIARIAPDAAPALHEAQGVVFVDIRNLRELGREGQFPDARHAPRGRLQF